MTTTPIAPSLPPADLALLSELRDFVYRERDTAMARLLALWELPMLEKKRKGLVQCLRGIEAGPQSTMAWASLTGGESRFRAGDSVRLHTGSPFDDVLAHNVVIEDEEEDRWLLRFRNPADVPPANDVHTYYAEQDSIDLTPLFNQSLDEIAEDVDARNAILPLLSGSVPLSFYLPDDESARQVALDEGLNERQADAVGNAMSAEQLACIQGPPGTGKTKVLALIARLMVARGERVMMTSHTHTAINNALERIAAGGVATVKIGNVNQARGLSAHIARAERFSEWKERPVNAGYVLGATPFATCGRRLDMCKFDVIIFDEASQVTIPLALMAMRRGKRFVFIGDQQQLPPVVLARSVLSATPSVFSRLTTNNPNSIMLRETYRMNRWLAAWPSRTFYKNRLKAAGANAERVLQLAPPSKPSFAATVLRHDASAVFIPTLDRTARSFNGADARLVAALCKEAVQGGLALDAIGIVTPFRAQGRGIRSELSAAFGWESARQIIADTVERMQGQERELVILSLTTGDLGYLAAIAEFFFQPERLNVSVTRAMTKLVIIGPDIPPEFRHIEEDLDRFIATYRDLIASCARLDMRA